MPKRKEHSDPDIIDGEEHDTAVCNFCGNDKALSHTETYEMVTIPEPRLKRKTVCICRDCAVVVVRDFVEKDGRV